MNKKKRTQPHPPEPPPRPFPWLWLALGAAVLLVAVGAYLLGAPAGVDPNFVPEVTGAPKLAVAQPLSDAGYVKYGTPVKAAFSLRNVGDEPLQILDKPQVELIEGCWPPSAVVGTTTLKPGQETTLTMDYSMTEGMGGPHEFHVRVQTNDPAQPEMVLIAKSNWGP